MATTSDHFGASDKGLEDHETVDSFSRRLGQKAKRPTKGCRTSMGASAQSLFIKNQPFVVQVSSLMRPTSDLAINEGKLPGVHS
jgi:hypothetical protein